MAKSILHPDIYIDNITSISLEYLKKHNIKGLILDSDNTLLHYKEKIEIDGLNDWILNMKKEGFKLIIVSNTNKTKKIEYISEKYDLPYEYIALKPLGFGLNRGKKRLGLESNEIAVIGDQIFTDVIGANFKKMHSILVKPLRKYNESFFTTINRVFEKKIIENYLKTNEIKNKQNIDK